MFWVQTLYSSMPWLYYVLKCLCLFPQGVHIISSFCNTVLWARLVGRTHSSQARWSSLAHDWMPIRPPHCGPHDHLKHLLAKPARNCRLTCSRWATLVLPKIDTPYPRRATDGDGAIRRSRAKLQISGGTNSVTTRKILPLYLGAAVSPWNPNPPFPLWSSSTIRHPWRRRELPHRPGPATRRWWPWNSSQLLHLPWPRYCQIIRW
jgi:hypothetical protein